ncbi:lipid II:glycine glycyltransferase FemX [Thermodesulfobacteriota bacterium]
MTNLQILNDVDPTEWNNDVVRLNGCCFHSYEWSLFSSEGANTKPLYFRLYNELNTLRSLAIGRLTTKNLAGIPVYKTFSLGCLPVSDSKSAFRVMVNEIISYCRKNHIVSLGIHSFGTPFGSEILQDQGFSVEKRWEFLLDIDSKEEEIWKKFDSKKRNKIRKALNTELRIEKGLSLDNVMQFRELALETQRRKREQGISFPVADDTYYALLKTKVIDPGLGRLYLAYDRARPVAGAFFVGYNKSAYYMLSSANDQGLKKAAPDLILWTCIRHYKGEGYKVFNFGGVSERELKGQPLEKSGLYVFKKTFCTDVYPCYKGTIILRPINYKIYKLLKKSKSSLFKHG